eukprot:1257275-Pleurochrysis_carterae.AAC.1
MEADGKKSKESQDAAVAEAKHAAKAAAAQTVAEITNRMVVSALDNPHNLSPNSSRIVAAKIHSLPLRKTFTVEKLSRSTKSKQGWTGRGGERSIVPIMNCYKPLEELSGQQLRAHTG